MAPRPRPATERFWEKVEKTDGCWLWTAATWKKTGYGAFQGNCAHIFSYVEANGPVPEGLELDHLCAVKNCVRVDHLEAVTPNENKRRQAMRRTHCKYGHAFTAENIYLIPKGRACRTCRAEYRQRRAAA